MFAIGDQTTWDDYEATVPITINGLNEEGFNPIPAGPGIGLILRWPGYYQRNSEQPREGWENLGALAWNRWRENDDDEIVSGLQMLGYGGDEVETNPDVQLDNISFSRVVGHRICPEFRLFIHHFQWPKVELIPFRLEFLRIIVMVRMGCNVHVFVFCGYHRYIDLDISPWLEIQ